MKRSLLIVTAVAAVLAAAAGCRMEEPEHNTKARALRHAYQVHFVAEEIQTRTVFGDPEEVSGAIEYPTFWSGNNEQIAVSLNLSNAKSADVIASQDGKSAEFDVSFKGSTEEAPFTFYALSPFSACIGATSSHGGYHLNIPGEQTPLAGSCDESAQILAASQTAQSPDEFGNILLKFAHVTAYGKLTLKNMSIPDGDEVLSIDITASEPIAGRFYYDFGQGALSESASSRSITIYPDNLDLTAGSQSGTFDMADIWFACAPADLGGGSLQIVVNTTNLKLTRTVSISSGRLAFNAGRVSKFSVDMAEADMEEAVDRWVLVTDISRLKAGDDVIIADAATAGSADAISTTQYDKYRGYASVQLTQEGGTVVIKNPGSTVEHFTVVAGTGNYSSCFRFKDATDTAEGYLAAPNSSSQNYLQTSNYNNGLDNWVVTVTSQGTVISTYSMVQYSGSSYRHIRFNSDRFATYKSSSRTEWNSTTTGTKPTYIYRKESGNNANDDPILEYEQYGAYLPGGNNLYGAGRQISRQWHSDGTLTFAILSPASYEVAEFIGIPADLAKGDSFTLTYSLISRRNQSDTDYNVTVVKVDGPKVWLSLGSGNGFIVKK